MKKKSVLIGILAGLACLGISSGAIVAMATNQDETVSLSQISIQEEYSRGESFVVPSAQMTKGDEVKDAQSVVVCPDGSKYTYTSFPLSQAGRYTIEYSAYFDGVKYTETVSFDVSQPLYEVKNNIAGTATYYENYEIEEFDGSTSSLSGVLVELPAGGEFVFNDIVDFSQKTRMDSFINFLVLPTEIGKEDIDYLYFKLTDIHDSENYVLISYHDVDHSAVEYGETVMSPSENSATLGQMIDYSYVFTRTYAKAGAAFQSQVGVEGAMGKVHKDNMYGYPADRTSFHGTPTIDPATALSNGYLKNAFTSVALDYTTKGVYSNDGFVTDLDDLTYYTDKWEGFTTGEAYVSMYAGTYVTGEPAKIFISDISGFDLSQNKFIDRNGPTVTVNFDGIDSQNLPIGVVGYTYPVYGATALDAIDGVLDVEVSAYYNYNSTNRTLCEISNGKISPNRPGLYSLIYRATDTSGNVTELRYDFNVVSSMADMAATLIGENLSASYVGATVSLANVEVQNYIEKYETIITVTCGNTIFEVEDWKFIPTMVGDYEIAYTITDFVGRKATVRSELSVSGAGVPVFYENPIFPKALISGKEYTYPILKAYDYSVNSNGEETAVKVYLTDKDGRREVTETTVIPKVNNSGDEVIFEYVTSNSYGEKKLSYKVKTYIVTKDTGLDIGSYFIKEGDLTVTTQSAYTTFETKKGGEFTFLNALLANKMDVTFSVNSKKNGFNRIDVYLTDSENDSIAIKASFYKDGTASFVRINDNKDNYILKSSFTNEKFGFYLRFNGHVNTFTTDSDESVTLPISKTLNGENFNGFPSGKVYLRMVLGASDTASEVRVSKISGQPITNTTRDNIKPSVSIFGEYATRYQLNEKIKLFDAIAGDVLDSNVEFRMSVKSPNGEFVKDTTGLLLKNVAVDSYEIVLSEYGDYSILYNVEDSAGKENLHKATLRVLDDVAPVITVSGNNLTKAKLGETIQIAQATAKDAVEGDVDVYIYLEDPLGARTQLVGRQKEEYSFTASKKGVYKLIYFATDTNGNMVVEYFEVVVQ